LLIRVSVRANALHIEGTVIPSPLFGTALVVGQSANSHTPPRNLTFYFGGKIMATPKKRKSSVPAGSANRPRHKKNVHLTWDNQNHQPGWTQAEVEALSTPPPNDGRTSSKTGGKAFDGGDKPVDGTKHVTKKGRIVKK